MLFRVKSVATGQTQRVTAKGTLEDLRAAAREAFSLPEARLSLNKREELTGSGGLHEAGLRSGDMVYLMDQGADLAPAPPVEAMQAEEPAPQPRENPAPVQAAAAPPPPVAAAPPADPDAELPPELLARLQQLLAAASPSSAQELLLLLTHAAMLEAGFVPLGTAAASPAACWGAGGIAAVDYGHAARPAEDRGAEPPVAVQVKALSMGPAGHAPGAVLAITALALDPEGSAHHPVAYQARVADYVAPSAGTGWGDPARLHLPGRLARDLRTRVVQPLAAQVRGPSASVGLVALGVELRHQLLRHLDARSLARAGAACRDLRAAARDEGLWEALYRRDFGGPAGARAPPAGYRRAYEHRVRAAVQVRREEEAARRSLRDDRVPPPWGPGPPHGPGVPYPGGEPGFPGMIGGDHDRFPAGLPGRLPFGGLLGPGGGGGGGVPMPFGDPDGRLPRGAVPPGSRFDPIHPDMDVDGAFGGVGGVPLPGRGMGRGGGFGGRGRGRGLHPDLPDPSRFDFM